MGVYGAGLPAKRQTAEQAREIAERNRRASDERIRKLKADEAARVAEADKERDVQQTERLTAELRVGYFSAPGATEDGFRAALPGLLEDRRRDAATSQSDGMRRQIAFSIRNLL